MTDPTTHQPAHHDGDPRCQEIARHLVVSDWDSLTQTDQTLLLNSAASLLLATEKAGFTLAKPTAAAPAGLRDRIARALHGYDYDHDLSRNDIPGEHHYREADAVLAVLPAPAAEVAALAGLVGHLDHIKTDRGREISRLRARVAELEGDNRWLRDGRKRAHDRARELEQQAARVRADAYRSAADDISPSDDCDCGGCAICADLASAALLRDLADRMTAGQAANHTAEQPAQHGEERPEDAARRFARRLHAVEQLCSGLPGYHTITVKQLLTAMSDADEQGADQ